MMNKIKWLFLSVVAVSISASVWGGVPLKAEVPQPAYELGPQGEIPRWFMLGYLPIPGDTNAWAKTLDTDLLADAGGEAALRNPGGQTVRADGTNWTWRMADTIPLVMPSLHARAGWLPLFDGPDGKPMENTAAYMFCSLVSHAPVEAMLLLSSDDSAKVWLNGGVVHRFVGQRSIFEDSDKVHLTLAAGANALLVRVDNYVGNGGLVARLVDQQGAPLRSVSVLAASDEVPALEQPQAVVKSWTNLIAEIPPLPPAPDAGQFGARLGRTMALLETSALTRRPVRIIFYGQSITAQEWTGLLVQCLRERYPHAVIEAENVALGGWPMPVLMRTLGHNVLRSRPDLVVFHVYGGSLDQWDRVISTIRRETCADILMRSAHPDMFCTPVHDQGGLEADACELRAVAQKFDCEFVECRREWSDYLKVNGIAVSNMLHDSIHLNRQGNVLMAQLYARHFRVNTAACGGWADRVRWYGARRQLEEHKDDEITLRGEWRDNGRWVESRASDASLRLPFIGNRVDVMLAPGNGSARVLIDGQPPSAQKLYHGTLPLQASVRRTPVLRRYFTGTNMVAEAWTLKVTEWTGDGKRFRYRVSGSVTGPDGEGESGQDFVSRSGRIRIYADDFTSQAAPPVAEQGPDPQALRPAPDDLEWTWRIVSKSCDGIRSMPYNSHDKRHPQINEPLVNRELAPPDNSRANPSYTWVTVADGLPFGRHELTLITTGNAPIGIVGMEVSRPPLAGEP